MNIDLLFRETQNSKSKKKIMKAMDRMWSHLIFATYGNRCVLCGKPAVDSHHIIRRSKSNALRYDIKNGVPLCKGCHFFGIHKGSTEHHKALLEWIGEEKYAYLQQKKNEYTKMNISSLRERAKELYEQLKKAEQ